MLKFLKAFFTAPTKDWRRNVSDPVLGELILNNEATCWDAWPEVDGKKVNFQIGGEGEPDPALIKHAHDIIKSFKEFEKAAKQALEAGKINFKGYEEEIEKQEIESVAFFWPKRPDDGMIFLKGPDEYRLWRLDYIGRKPQGLGFDS